MASVKVTELNKRFGETHVLKGVSVEVPDGAFAVLVGPSGCGKSTLLRLLAGLEEADEGQIFLGDREVTRLEPRERDIAMVFQSYALYPHLTVRENLAFGLKLRKTPAAEIDKRLGEASEMLGLGPLLDRYPKALSGGQRQRVAMGRAIVRRAQLFLFDEPLSNLDAALRAQVRVDIRKLHDRLGATSVYVTHDQVEAMTLADVLFVLNKGVVEQAGPPLEIYAHPRTRFVAGFLGSPAMNFLEARLEERDGQWVAALGREGREGREGGDQREVQVALDAEAFGEELQAGRKVTLGVRPHDVELSQDGSGAGGAGGVGDAGGAGGVALKVSIVEALGVESLAYGTLAGAHFVARLEPTAKVGKGQTVQILFRHVHLFDADTGLSLRASAKKA